MAVTFTIGDQVVICESDQCGEILDIRRCWAIVKLHDTDKKIVIPTVNLMKLLNK